MSKIDEDLLQIANDWMNQSIDLGITEAANSLAELLTRIRNEGFDCGTTVESEEAYFDKKYLRELKSAICGDNTDLAFDLVVAKAKRIAAAEKIALDARNFYDHRKGFESMEKLHESLKESGE